MQDVRNSRRPKSSQLLEEVSESAFACIEFAEEERLARRSDRSNYDRLFPKRAKDQFHFIEKSEADREDLFGHGLRLALNSSLARRSDEMEQLGRSVLDFSERVRSVRQARRGMGEIIKTAAQLYKTTHLSRELQRISWLQEGLACAFFFEDNVAVHVGASLRRQVLQVREFSPTAIEWCTEQLCYLADAQGWLHVRELERNLSLRSFQPQAPGSVILRRSESPALAAFDRQCRANVVLVGHGPDLAVFDLALREPFVQALKPSLGYFNHAKQVAILGETFVGALSSCGEFLVWDLRNLERPFRRTGGAEDVLLFDYSPNYSSLLVVLTRKSLAVINLQTDTYLDKVCMQMPIVHVSWHADGRIVCVVGANHPGLLVYRLNSRQRLVLEDEITTESQTQAEIFCARGNKATSHLLCIGDFDFCCPHELTTNYSILQL